MCREEEWERKDQEDGIRVWERDQRGRGITGWGKGRRTKGWEGESYYGDHVVGEGERDHRGKGRGITE